MMHSPNAAIALPTSVILTERQKNKKLEQFGKATKKKYQIELQSHSHGITDDNRIIGHPCSTTLLSHAAQLRTLRPGAVIMMST